MTPIKLQEFQAMENGFFVIRVPIVVTFAYDLSRFSRFAPEKRSRPIRAGLLLIAASLFFANFAPAAQVRTVITGTFSQGTDNSGTFVPPPYLYGNLTGKAYTLVFEMDDDPKKSVPYYGTWPASCANGVQNFGLNTPVPHAVLTVSGKSYTFGVRPATFISSYAFSLNATVPQTQLSTHFYQTRFDSADMSLWGSEAAAVNIYLKSIYKCRSWETAFSYALVPGKGDYYDGQVSVLYRNLNSGAIYTNFSGYLNVSTVTVSGPITPPKTPHIFFFDSAKGKFFDVTNSTVPVVAGEPIYLFAIPAGNPTQPKAWNVPGSTVGAFLLTPRPAPTLGPSCAEITNPVPGCAEIAMPDFARESTRFYWTEPGTYDLSYRSSSGSATTSFYVAEPTSVEVTASAKGPATIGDDPISHALKSVLFWGNYPNAGGVTFSATAVQPTQQSGQFRWVQVISQNDLVHKSLTGVSLNCPFGVGLDNYFFYQEPGAIKDYFVDDNPYFSLDLTDATTTRMMQAKMFLLWQATMNDSIPITLGYTEWRVTYGVDHTTNPQEPWSVFGTGATFPFEKTSVYPTWTSVVDNKNRPPCDLPQQ
jgi:hypothetical protein